MVAVLWGSDLGKGIVDGVAVPCCSWCFDGILKPFHHDLRSRLLGGETADWIWAATGVLGGFGAFARGGCWCCDAGGWDGGVGAADVMVATARRWAAEMPPRCWAVCCVSASPGSRVQDRIESCMNECESEMKRQRGRGTWGSPERYARGYALRAVVGDDCRVVLRRGAVAGRGPFLGYRRRSIAQLSAGSLETAGMLWAAAQEQAQEHTGPSRWTLSVQDQHCFVACFRRDRLFGGCRLVKLS